MNNTHVNGILENAGKGSNNNDELGLALKGSFLNISNGFTSSESVSAESLLAAAQAAERNRNNPVKSYNYTTEVSETTTGIQFNPADAESYNGVNELAVSPSYYVEALTESLSDTFNAPEFIEGLKDTGLNVEVRAPRTQPVPQIIHELKDRTFYFDRNERFISAGAAPVGSTGSGVLNAGGEIHIEPFKAIGFNFATKVYDHHIMTNGFTKHTLEIAVENAIHDVCMSISAAIANTLAAADGCKNVKLMPLDTTGKSAAQVSEMLMDALTYNVNQTGFADLLSDVSIIMPAGVEAILEREATKNGFADVEDMLGGAVVMSYDHAQVQEQAIYMVSKRLCALSFATAKDGSGDIFKVTATRDASRQAWTIEGFGVLDVIAKAGTEIDMDGKTVKADIAHIVKITFDGTKAAAASIPGITKA